MSCYSSNWVLFLHNYKTVGYRMLRLNDQNSNPMGDRTQRPAGEVKMSVQNNVFPVGLERVDYNSNYANNYVNHEAAPPTKVTRYDQINKNYIFPQEAFKGESNYTGTYKNNVDSRVRAEKVSYPENDVLPKGKFQGNSSYLDSYVNAQAVRSGIIKHEGELKVGGKFEGSSSYADNYLGKSNEKQPKRLFKPQGQLKVGGQFYGQSNYSNNYYDKGYQGKLQKFVPPSNQVLPEGRFNNQGTTYGNNYVSNPIQRSQQFRPEAQIVLGNNKFEAVSSYGAEYIKKEKAASSQKTPLPQNFVLPKGQFVGSSTYGDNYVPGTIQRSQQFRPQGELKIGGKFQGCSSYANDFDEKNRSNGKREKVQFQENEVLPKGQFQGNSTYQQNYLFNEKATPSKLVKQPEQLKVGGQFYGSSNYASAFDDKGLMGRQEKAVMPQNKIFSQGKFEDFTTYGGNYVKNPVQKNVAYRPEGELKVDGGVFNANSSYGSDYIKKEGEARQKTISYPSNDVLPKGNFVGNSTYGENYIQNRIERREKVHYQPNLKVGGHFEGNSNYAQTYDGGASPPKYLNKQNDYDVKQRQK